MKFYTKEWYELMKHLFYTSGMRKIPDQTYTDADIRAFYDQDLKEELERDLTIHNTPPYPPFDPAKTKACFRDMYRVMLRCGISNFPQWAKESVDKRLVALRRLPESVYNRLEKEEQANRLVFEKINAEATAVREQQDIPLVFRSQFRFHDADVLVIRKMRSDVELYLRALTESTTPYVKITFQNVSLYDREPGFALRPKMNKHGELSTSCSYLYDEFYRDENGYEVHMMFWTRKALRYLTICSEDIEFEDNIPLDAIP